MCKGSGKKASEGGQEQRGFQADDSLGYKNQEIEVIGKEIGLVMTRKLAVDFTQK